MGICYLSDWIKSRMSKYQNGNSILISDLFLDMYNFLYEEEQIRHRNFEIDKQSFESHKEYSDLKKNKEMVLICIFPWNMKAQLAYAK
jgi:hypothetical protein